MLLGLDGFVLRGAGIAQQPAPHRDPLTVRLRVAAPPEHAALIQRVLAIPAKRFDKPILSLLTATEVDALIDPPDLTRWEGRRERALLLVAVQTGLRVSELTGLDCGDVTLGTGANVRCEGKGRKHRAVPLTAASEAVVSVWLTERAGRRDEPAFPTRTGRRLSTDAVEKLVHKHAVTAAARCPSFGVDNVHPHTLRHSCAMSLLQAGVDTAVIALWMGHADIRSTHTYLHADITIKQRALELTTPTSSPPGGSPALFRLVTGARDVLLDPSSRAAYDAEFLPVGPQGPGQQEAPIHEPPRAQYQTSQPSETRMEPNRTLLSAAERICRRRMAWSTAASLILGAWSIYVDEMHGELLAGLPAFLLFCTYVWHWVVVRQSYSVMLSDWGLEWGRVPAIGPVIILVRLLGDSFGITPRPWHSSSRPRGQATLGWSG